MPSTNPPPSEPRRESQAGHFLSHRRLFLESLAVVAVSLLLLVPHYHLPLSVADEGIIATGAERILRGQVPYRDFFTELGPASYCLQAIIFKIGAMNVRALRLTAWLLGGALSGLIFLLARRILRESLALLATAVFPLICYPAAYRVSHHWWANLFQLLTVLSLVACVPRTPGVGVSRERRGLLLAGTLAAATLLAMQSKGFWLIVMSVAFLVVEPWVDTRNRWQEVWKLGLRNTSWFLIGTIVPFGAVAVYFMLRGALGAWLEDNFLFLFTNYRPYNDVPQASAVQTLVHIGTFALTQPSVHFCLYFVGYLFFGFVAPAIAFGGTAWQLLSASRPRHAEGQILFLLLLEGVGAFFSEYHSPDAPHLMWAAPLMLVLVVYQWGRAVSRSHVLRRPARIMAVLATGVLLFTAGRKAVNALRIDGRVQTRRGIVYVDTSYAHKTQQTVDAIQWRVPPGGETFFYPYTAELYFLTATRNPTRFDVLLPDFHRAAHIDETITRLKSARPDFIFSFDKIQRWTIRPHFPDDPPDVVGSHPVEWALMAPDSGYHPAAVVAEMEVWKADK